MPIVVIMLLLFCTVAMTNPKATIYSLLATLSVYLAYRLLTPYLPSIPTDYLIIAMISCLLGAGGMIVFLRVRA